MVLQRAATRENHQNIHRTTKRQRLFWKEPSELRINCLPSESQITSYWKVHERTIKQTFIIYSCFVSEVHKLLTLTF